MMRRTKGIKKAMMIGIRGLIHHFIKEVLRVFSHRQIILSTKHMVPREGVPYVLDTNIVPKEVWLKEYHFSKIIMNSFGDYIMKRLNERFSMVEFVYDPKKETMRGKWNTIAQSGMLSTKS